METISESTNTLQSLSQDLARVVERVSTAVNCRVGSCNHTFVANSFENAMMHRSIWYKACYIRRSVGGGSGQFSSADSRPGNHKEGSRKLNAKLEELTRTMGERWFMFLN